jgi:hypothetical protein
MAFRRKKLLRIVVSAGILSLMRLIPAKQRIAGSSISASSIAGSLMPYLLHQVNS